MEYDLALIHPPSVIDFRKRPWFPGPVARTVHFTPAFYGIPIGLISMADYVERKGYKVVIFNLAEYMLTDPKFDHEKFIKDIRARYYGVGLHFCVHSQGAVEVARICKQHHEDSKVIMGGLTATIFANELIKNHRFIDYVIQGEGEIPLLNILEGGTVEEIPNLIYRDNDGRIRTNQQFWVARSLDDFEFTRLDLVNPNKLLTTVPTELGIKKHWMIPLYRGCYYNCATCGGSRYCYRNRFHREKPAFRSKEKVIEDLRKLSKQGIESVFLFMDPRAMGRKKCSALFDALRSNDYGINYLTLELFLPGNRKYLSEIARLNNKVSVGLSISPESGNENVRTSQGRVYSNESLLKTVRFCTSHGIGLGVFFMFGLAEQTWETLDDTYKLFSKLSEINSEEQIGPGIRIQFGEMLLLDPGSLAFDNPQKFGYKLRFKNLQDYIDGFSSPAWTDWLSYETYNLNRRELLEIPIRFRHKLVEYYNSNHLITNDQAKLEHLKGKIDMEILNELEDIRRLDSKEKEKRYWSLYHALRDYDKGGLSMFWRIKKRLGLQNL